MAGGYLFKMWGLPAAALAIWHSARPENRARILAEMNAVYPGKIVWGEDLAKIRLDGPET